MKKNLLKFSLIIVLVLVFVSPTLIFAQPVSTSTTTLSFPFNGATSSCTSTGIGNVICQLQLLLNFLLPLLITLGIVYFVWGVVQFMIGGGEEAKTKGRDRIIYGLIGLAVIVGVWGLVNIVVRTFDLGATGSTVAQNINNLVPPSGSACTLPNNPKFADVLNYFTCTIDQSVIPFIFAVAMVSFVWGAVKFFIINSDEEAKREQGKQFMIWSIIALAVMISVWGLVNIVSVTFGIHNSVLPHVGPYTQQSQ